MNPHVRREEWIKIFYIMLLHGDAISSDNITKNACNTHPITITSWSSRYKKVVHINYNQGLNLEQKLINNQMVSKHRVFSQDMTFYDGLCKHKTNINIGIMLPFSYFTTYFFPSICWQQRAFQSRLLQYFWPWSITLFHNKSSFMKALHNPC